VYAEGAVVDRRVMLLFYPDILSEETAKPAYKIGNVIFSDLKQLE
jgi:hypothetical protein